MALPRRRPRDPEGRMPLGEHLRELRQRIVKSGITLLIATAFGWFVYDPVIEDLLKPYKDYEAAHPDKVVTTAYSGLTSAFSQHLSIAIFLGVLISSPVWLYQIWAFIVPGLTKKEKRISLSFIAAAVPLFLAGRLIVLGSVPHTFELQLLLSLSYAVYCLQQ